MSEFKFVMPTGSTSLVGGPIANFSAGGTVSDCVKLAEYQTAYFFFLWGVSTGGTATPTFTVIPCASDGGTTTTAIPFQYKRVSSIETNTAWAWATLNTLTAIAGSQQMYIIKVSADDLPLVSGVKYEWVYVNIVETVADALLGGGFVMLTDARYSEATMDNAAS